MKAYIVKLSWATEYDKDYEINVYDTYEKAYAKFKELIAEQKDPERSWFGVLEWKNGRPTDDHIKLGFYDRKGESEETECYWYISDNWGSNTYTDISILVREML